MFWSWRLSPLVTSPRGMVKVIYRSVAGDYSSSLMVRMAMINAIRSVCCQLQVIGIAPMKMMERIIPARKRSLEDALETRFILA